MLTDKQIFLCCGLLSLGFHLCSWGVWNSNCQLWGQNSKPPVSIIQISLITEKMAGAEVASKKKGPNPLITAVKNSPLIAASPVTQLENIPRSETVKETPQLISKATLLQQTAQPKKVKKQLRQKTTTPLAEKPEIKITKTNPLKSATTQTTAETTPKVQGSVVKRNHKEKEIAGYRVEQRSTAAIPGNRGKGQAVEGSGQGIELAYLVHIRQMIEKHLDYPARARRLHITGEVNLRFNINAGGSIDEILVLAESSYPILNKAAIRAVKQAAPFPQPQRKINVELPILFSLN